MVTSFIGSMVRVDLKQSLDNDQGEEHQGNEHLDDSAAGGGFHWSDHRLPRRRKAEHTARNCRACPGCGWMAQMLAALARTNLDGRSWPQRTHCPRWSFKAPLWRALMMPDDQRSMVGRYFIRWTA